MHRLSVCSSSMLLRFFPDYREDLLTRIDFDFLAETKTLMPEDIDFRRYIQLHDLLQADLIERAKRENNNKPPK